MGISCPSNNGSKLYDIRQTMSQWVGWDLSVLTFAYSEIPSMNGSPDNDTGDDEHATRTGRPRRATPKTA